MVASVLLLVILVGDGGQLIASSAAPQRSTHRQLSGSSDSRAARSAWALELHEVRESGFCLLCSVAPAVSAQCFSVAMRLAGWILDPWPGMEPDPRP